MEKFGRFMDVFIPLLIWVSVGILAFRKPSGMIMFVILNGGLFWAYRLYRREIEKENAPRKFQKIGGVEIVVDERLEEIERK